MVATSALVVPLTRRTAAPRPGPATVSAPTVESYWWKTSWREARLADPSRASSTAPGSIPRSGRRSTGSIGAPGAGAARWWVGRIATRWWTMASLVSALAGIRAISTAPGFGRPSASSPPSTMAMSPSAVTRPMIATGRPQRVQTSRTSSHFAGRTAAHIRSCDSEIITSNGSRPGSRRGIASRSTSIPVPPRSAVSEVAHVMPPAPRSWSPSTRPRSMSSRLASISSFSANGSPT